MPAPTPPDPAVVGINTLLEGELPDSVANYDSLAAFAARTETDLEDELTGTEQTRFGRIFTGFFSGLPTGKPFLASLIQAIIHKAFPGTTTQYSTSANALTALETKFTDKWYNLSGIVSGTADTLWGTTTDGTVESAAAALGNTYNTVQGLAADVAAMKTRNNAGAAGGKNYTVDFSKYPERFLSGAQSGSFPEYPATATADFTLTYSGAGTGSLSILDGKAHWTPGTGSRTVFARYRDKTDTDYQILTGTVASPMSAGGAQNWILGRCNSAGDTFVYAYGYANSLLDFRAELGCYVSGVKTVFATNVAAQPNFNLALRIGDTGGVRHFQVLSGNKVIIDYTDSANTSQYGSSYRYWGFQSVANGSSVPADAVLVAGADAPIDPADAANPLSTTVQNALSTKEPTITAGTTSQYWRGDKSWQTLNAAAVSGAEATANKGSANGYASLDSAGKVPVAQLPNSIMEYQGTWNASTNTPTLADGTGSAGDVYRVSAAASRDLGSGSIDFAVGDYVIYSGSVWEKADCTDAVASVNGYTGTITLSKSDVGLGNVDNTSDATKNSAVAALTNKDLTSGTNTFPTFNQSTTGSAATLTTGRTFRTDLASTSTATFDGSANVTPGVTGTLPVANGGTGATTLTGLLVGNATSAVTAVSAPSGVVVGTTDTQALTNKDLTSATNSFPTLNQSTTGSAAKWTTARNLAGNSVDGSADVAFANKFVVQGTTDTGLSGAQFLGSLGTGIVKNTTSTGVLSIAVAGDFPTLNQSTTGSAATLTTGRTVQINLASTSSATFDGSANITPGVTGTLPVTNGGTGATTFTSGAILKGAGTSAITTATAGTDYVAPGGALGTPSSGTLTNCTFPTLNQNTTGSAATLTTARTVRTDLASTSTASFDGSANITPGVTGTLPVTNGGTGTTTLTGLLLGNGTSAFTTVTAPSGTVVGTSDAQTITNKIVLPPVSSTATAAGTTTLTIASNPVQAFTGTSSQTVVLPTTGVDRGTQYFIFNSSSGGSITVQSSGLNTIATVPSGAAGIFTARLPTPTTATGWIGAITQLGKALTVNNSLTLSGTDGDTLTVPSGGGTALVSGGALGTPSSATLTNATGLPLAGLTAAAYASAATASVLAQRDANANLSADAFIPTVASTATAAGTTTLTIDSAQVQVFTGTSTQTVKLPTTSVTAGQTYTVINQSSGNVTVQSSGGNTISTLTGGTVAGTIYLALKSTPTAAADWRAI